MTTAVNLAGSVWADPAAGRHVASAATQPSSAGAITVRVLPSSR